MRTTLNLERSSRAANSGFMLSGQFIGKGALFLSIMLLSRYLPDADFGGLLFSIILGQVYLLFSDMGVSLVINMRISTRPEDSQELLSRSITLKTVLTMLGLPLVVLAGVTLGMSQQRLLVLSIIGLSVIFESYTEIFYSIFRARERMVYESSSRILMGLTGLALVITAIHFRSGLLVIAMTYVVRAMVAFTASLFCLKRMGFTLSLSRKLGKVKELLSASIPLGIMGLVIVLHQRADNVIIRQMMGENAVAAWQECLRIIEILILLVVPTLLPGALFPALCRAFRDREYQRQTGDMARVFTALAVMPSLAVISTGNRFMRYIWGVDYLRGISPGTLQLCLYLSLMGLAVLYLMNIMINSLLAVNKIKIVIPVTLSALVLVVAGNLLFIPIVGLASAGIFFVTGNLLVLLSYWFFLRWRGYRLPIWREALISIAVSIPAFAIIPLTRGMPFLPALVLPVAVYAPVWWFTGGGRAAGRLFPGRDTSE